MSCPYTTFSEILSDAVLFPALQVALAIFVLFAVLRSWLQARKSGRGSVTGSVTRGEGSMGRFYGTYAVISSLLIAICLSVDVAQNHRVLWVVIDTGLVAYVCLFNPWFRNRLLGWAERLTKIEER